MNEYNELMNALRSALLYMEDLNDCDAEADALFVAIAFLKGKKPELTNYLTGH